MPFGGLFVFVEGHHVDRAHLFDSLAQLLAGRLFRRQLLAGRVRTISASARITAASTLISVRQLASRYSRSDRSLATMLGPVAAIVAELIEPARAVLSSVSMPASFCRNSCASVVSVCAQDKSFVALRRQFLLAHGKLGALTYALFPLCFGRCPLLFDGQHAALKVGMEPVDALEGCFGAAPAFFELGQLCCDLRGFLLKGFARSAAACPNASASQSARLRLLRAPLQAAPSLFALLCDHFVLGLTRVLVACGLQHPLLQAALDALGLGLHLLEGCALVGGVALGQAALFAARFQLRGELLDAAGERSGLGSLLCRDGPRGRPAWRRSRAARASAPADLRWRACRPSQSHCGSTRLPGVRKNA